VEIFLDVEDGSVEKHVEKKCFLREFILMVTEVRWKDWDSEDGGG
jgi:hypothetical protein